MYEIGEGGLEQDFKKAASLYLKAAELGDVIAEYNLGVFFEHGIGVSKDQSVSARYLERAAEKGDASAQLNLGLLHKQGIDGRPDYLKALYWLQLAAESRNPKAHGAIAEMYINGWGVEKNPAKAIEYFEVSASQGEVHSQYNLAIFLRSIDELPETLENVAYWLGQAAELGFAPAQIDLGLLYIQGKGVEVDHAEGYKWVLIGTEGGDQRGPQLLIYCSQNLEQRDLEAGRLRAAAFTKSISDSGIEH
jgi:TPR repeat protein